MSPTRRRNRGHVVAPNEPPTDELPPEDEEESELPDRGDLEDLADPRYAGWTWHIYRLRSLEDMARLKTKIQRPWVLSIEGPLSKVGLRDAVGGGVFEAWGYITGERGVRERHLFEMEGPPREYTPPVVVVPPVAPAAAPASTPNGTDPVLLGVLQAILKSQEVLAAKMAAPPAQTGFSFREMLALSTTLAGRSGGGVEMKDLVALFQQGIEIGGSAAGGSEKGTLEIVLEKGIPALEKIAIAMSRRPVAPRPGAPGARPRPTSSATVIETEPTPTVTAPVMDPEPPAAELTPEQQAAAMRWGAAVDALSRALADGGDPEDFADTLDQLMLPDDIDLMLAGGTAEVMVQLRTAADRYPILNTPAAESFVDRVLASLANPDLATS